MNIDGKPKIRVPSARGSRRKAVETKPVEIPVVEEESLNIRVKERNGDDEVKRGRISGFLETPIKGFMSNTAAAAESLKRPLTGIFRRPGSKAGRKKEEDDDLMISSVVEPVMVNPAPKIKTAPNIEAVMAAMDFEGSSKAPKLPGAPFQGFQNDSFSKHPHLNKVDDIDLSLLSRVICLDEESNDESVSWTWDYLFTTLSSELRDEWAEGGGPPTADRRVG